MISKIMYIPLETKVREFHGKLFLAYLAIEAGYTVYFGDQNQLNGVIDLLPRGVYLNKSVAVTTISWHSYLRDKGFDVCSWDEEGLIYFSPEVYKKLRLAPESLEMVSDFFCWGEVQRNDILGYFEEFGDKIRITGNPRFDILRKEFHHFHEQAAAKYRLEYGQILLVNTNFAFYKHFRSQEDLQKMLSVFPLASVPGFIEGWIEYQRHGFDAFCEILPLMSEKYPDHTIILRPHPSENHEVWRKFAKKFDNIFVRSDGNVQEWIAASEVVIHSNCTTAVEAFLLGTYPISFVATENPIYENILPKKLSFNVFNKKELFEVIDESLEGNEKFKEKLWNDENWSFIKNYISGIDGPFAAERIINIIDQRHLAIVEDTSNSERFLRISKLFWRSYLFKYREWLHPPDGYIRHKQPGLTAAEVSETLNRFKEVLCENHRYQIKTVFKDVFKISKIN